MEREVPADRRADPDNRLLARYLRDAIGGNPKVYRLVDDENVTTVDVLDFKDAPILGTRTAATVTLSNTSIGLYFEGKELRVELVISYNDDCDFGTNILSTCAFNIIKDGWAIAHGSIFPRVVELYDDSIPMKHIMFSSVYFWDLRNIDLPSKTIAWLLAVPISEEERIYAARYGTDKLNDLLENLDIQSVDIYRQSAIRSDDLRIQ